MAYIFDDDQFAFFPDTAQLPSGIERSTKVEPAVNQRAWNSREPVRFAEQNALVQPNSVMEVMGHEPSERHAKCGILVPEAWLVCGIDRNACRFPITPAEGCLASSGIIGSMDQRVVRVHEIGIVA
jgi:hypothetical protein